jgi:hypothetical protein
MRWRDIERSAGQGGGPCLEMRAAAAVSFLWNNLRFPFTG